MENTINIATWNLCLGLANKKDSVLEYLASNNVHLCCLQETEIPCGFPENVLNCKGYNLELELNSVKKRAGIYRQSPVKSPDIKNIIVVTLTYCAMSFANL